MRRVSKRRQRQRRSPEGIAYRDMLLTTDRPWCWACGAEPPVDRAHLSAGGGRQLRVEDVRGVNLLCRDCHNFHMHHCDDETFLEVFDCLTDANMIWLKRERDPDNYDPEWIRSVWIGNPPEPVEPMWCRRVYKR